MYNEKDEKYTIAIPLYRIDKDLKLLIKRLLGILCIINILIFVIYNLFKIYINYKALQNQIKILRINENELLEEFKIQDKLNQMFHFVTDNTNDNTIILNNVINDSIKYLQNYFKFKDLKITIETQNIKEINLNINTKTLYQIFINLFCHIIKILPKYSDLIIVSYIENDQFYLRIKHTSFNYTSKQFLKYFTNFKTNINSPWIIDGLDLINLLDKENFIIDYEDNFNILILKKLLVPTTDTKCKIYKFKPLTNNII